MGEVKRVGAWATESVSGSRSKTTVTTTMERRKFMIGLGALATGSAAAVGTGAFTSVEADRQVDVTVEDDADAYLGLQNGPNDTYFEGEENGAAALDFSESGNDGSGVNPNAETEFDSVFQIVNQGTQEVTVSLSGDDDIAAGEDDASELDEGEIGIALASNGTIGTGDDPVDVNVAVNTGNDTNDLSGTLTISADATQQGDSNG